MNASLLLSNFHTKSIKTLTIFTRYTDYIIRFFPTIKKLILSLKITDN